MWSYNHCVNLEIKSDHEFVCSDSLPIVLSNQEYHLPWRHVGPESGGSWVAWFDPLRTELRQSGAKELARMLHVLGTTVMIAPPSAKSTRMIEEARACLEDLSQTPIDLITFLRGDPERTSDQFSVRYRPISSGGADRVMVASPQQAYLLHGHMEEGVPAFVDDVYSTGATVRAMKVLLGAMGIDPYKGNIPCVTVMSEGTTNTKPHNVFYAVRTPVVEQSALEIPRGHSAWPFLERKYTDAELAHFRSIAADTSLPATIRDTAKLASHEMANLSLVGAMLLSNINH